LFAAFVPVRINLNHPVVSAVDCKASRALAGRDARERSSPEDKAIRSAVHGEQLVCFLAAVSLVPLFVSAGISPNQPEVVRPEIRRGFVSRDAGGRGTAQQNCAIGGHAHGEQFLGIVATEGFIPNAIAISIDLHQPEIAQSLGGGAFVA
jgi:hypothetical protein